tara:strand:- start:295 stop:846 length:552 start_codon:yes stop_codon:yes gene_type:complete
MLLEKKSINIVDNFFNPWQFKLVLEEIKKLKYYDVENHPAHNATEIYPGSKTEPFTNVHPLLDSFIIKQVDSLNTSLTNYPYRAINFAHLRLKDSIEERQSHRDTSGEWAYIIYMSQTNLQSGTKIFSDDTTDVKNTKENLFVNFVQNRILLFDVSVPHMAWLNHGKNIDDGRLTINGFCNYL